MQAKNYTNWIIVILLGASLIACERTEVIRDNTDMIDPRDGQRYSTERYGNQVWMAENLAYNHPDSKFNTNNPFSEYGRLYSYQQAMEVCPDGWHLPTDVEWQEFERFLGVEAHTLGFSGHRGGNLGGHIKSNTGWVLNNGSNTKLFNAYPAGLYKEQGQVFEQLGQRAEFWSATQESTGKAWGRRLTKDFDSIFRGSNPMDYYLSCRCVQDE